MGRIDKRLGLSKGVKEGAKTKPAAKTPPPEAAPSAARSDEITDLRSILDRIGARIHELEPRPEVSERPARLAPAPAPPECPRCERSGYIVRGVGDVARAEVCSCRPTCWACGGEGHAIVQRDGYEYMEACEHCSGLKRRISLYNQAHVPALLAQKSVQAFDTRPHPSLEKAHGFLNTYVNTFPANRQGVLLVGPPGVGKTHLMCGVIRHLTLERGVRCLFKDFFLLLSELKEAWDTGGYQSEIMRPLGEVDVLVVDELGKGRNSEWELNLLDEIVCKRYNRHKTTLFTTNYPVRQVGKRPPPTRRRSKGPNLSEGAAGLPLLSERVSERVWSRLQEMCTVIELEAEDFRPRNSATWKQG